MISIAEYLKDPAAYSRYVQGTGRRPTREVPVGHLPLGGRQPIRIQSMTTADTLDTEAVVAETIRLADAGCDYVRITTPNLTTAKNLRAIKAALKARGYDVPLVADVHFTPNVAEEAARIVEKVRINPGNFVDKKSLNPTKEYTDADFEAAQERIRQRLRSLLAICKEYGTALRIGVNHGSLSDRMLYRYGDTPVGMVESAMEYLRICVDEGFYHVVISLKASNPLVMVAANRLMAAKMDEEGMDFPIHLGVTEAGEGEDARIKSALGIGMLLADGIGDTIRVSLAEPPEAEVPVARAIAGRYGEQYTRRMESSDAVPRLSWDPFLQKPSSVRPTVIGKVRGHYQPFDDDVPIPDAVWFTEAPASLPEDVPAIVPASSWEGRPTTFPWFEEKAPWQAFAAAHPEHEFYVYFASLEKALHTPLPSGGHRIVNTAGLTYKELRPLLLKTSSSQSVIWDVPLPADISDLMAVSTDIGGVMAEGWGHGLLWEHADAERWQWAFQVLQACRRRMFRTEFIACPSCGRTLFDLQTTTRKIQEALHDYPGLKIAIMGCIVNGFGEMADADYGYIGPGPGRIALFRGREMVRRNIPEAQAVEALRQLIEEDRKS